jgi:hypothetical protein
MLYVSYIRSHLRHFHPSSPSSPRTLTIQFIPKRSLFSLQSTQKSHSSNMMLHQPLARSFLPLHSLTKLHAWSPTLPLPRTLLHQLYAKYSILSSKIQRQAFSSTTRRFHESQAALEKQRAQLTNQPPSSNLGTQTQITASNTDHGISPELLNQDEAHTLALISGITLLLCFTGIACLYYEELSEGWKEVNMTRKAILYVRQKRVETKQRRPREMRGGSGGWKPSLP